MVVMHYAHVLLILAISASSMHIGIFRNRNQTWNKFEPGAGLLQGRVDASPLHKMNNNMRLVMHKIDRFHMLRSKGRDLPEEHKQKAIKGWARVLRTSKKSEAGAGLLQGPVDVSPLHKVNTNMRPIMHNIDRFHMLRAKGRDLPKEHGQESMKKVAKVLRTLKKSEAGAGLRQTPIDISPETVNTVTIAPEDLSYDMKSAAGTGLLQDAVDISPLRNVNTNMRPIMHNIDRFHMLRAQGRDLPKDHGLESMKKVSKVLRASKKSAASMALLQTPIDISPETLNTVTIAPEDLSYDMTATDVEAALPGGMQGSKDVGIGPSINHTAVVVSPSPAPEVSPSDLMEHVDHLIPPLVSDWAIPERTPQRRGGSCSEVCASCAIAATSHANCKCFANCLHGSDETLCQKKVEQPWVTSHQTQPSETWLSACNAGRVDCEQCMDAQLKEEIANCKTERIPSMCYHHVMLKLRSPASEEQYCFRGDLKACEKFLSPPLDEGGWTCFQEEVQCLRDLGDRPNTERLQAYAEDDSVMDQAETPCVWCAATGHEAPQG